ncbi:uncharacterized protein [Hemitrygon akajei]|uniref:uncharacterized protein isoform X3 n=1 Tax=Hemitrygon akajei TaxID=2704970 RepID=UPI003BF9E3F0
MSSRRVASQQGSPSLGVGTGSMEQPRSEVVNPSEVTQRPGSEVVHTTIRVTQRSGSEVLNPTKIVQRPESEVMKPTVTVTQRPGSEGTSHCTVFTYFKGDINSVVDEHFSRALGQRGRSETPSRAGEELRSVTWPQATMWPPPSLGGMFPVTGQNTKEGPVTTAGSLPVQRPVPGVGAADPWLLPAGAQHMGVLFQPHLLQPRNILPAVDSEGHYGLSTVPSTLPPRQKTAVPHPWTGISHHHPKGINPERGMRPERWGNEKAGDEDRRCRSRATTRRRRIGDGEP